MIDPPRIGMSQNTALGCGGPGGAYNRHRPEPVFCFKAFLAVRLSNLADLIRI